MATKDEVREMLFNPQNGIVTIAKQRGLGDLENRNVAEIEAFFSDEPKKKRGKIF